MRLNTDKALAFVGSASFGAFLEGNHASVALQTRVLRWEEMANALLQCLLSTQESIRGACDSDAFEQAQRWLDADLRAAAAACGATVRGEDLRQIPPQPKLHPRVEAEARWSSLRSKVAFAVQKRVESIREERGQPSRRKKQQRQATVKASSSSSSSSSGVGGTDGEEESHGKQKAENAEEEEEAEFASLQDLLQPATYQSQLDARVKRALDAFARDIKHTVISLVPEQRQGGDVRDTAVFADSLLTSLRTRLQRRGRQKK